MFGVDRRTVAEMLAYAVPPGYRSGPDFLGPGTGERIERQDNMATIEKRVTVKQGMRRSTTLLAAAVAPVMLREKLIKIGAKTVRHGRYIKFQLAEVASEDLCDRWSGEGQMWSGSKSLGVAIPTRRPQPNEGKS